MMQNLMLAGLVVMFVCYHINYQYTPLELLLGWSIFIQALVSSSKPNILLLHFMEIQ